MAVDASDLKRLSALLDTALELAPGAEEAWLASLPATDQPLLPALRRMLASHAKRETADFMQRSPMLALAPADDAPASPFAAGDTVGPYRLLRELGAGGMGEVWLAERADGGLKRQVALKLPTLGVRRAVLVQRFERERDILAGLEHPAIARLYDAGFADDGQPYLALEFVEGQPIDIWCRERALPVRERVKLLAQVGEAVAFAHSRLVLHRDLKPSNILVNADGHVRLLDFGIAKLMEGERTSETELTQQAGRALTLDYASPEQIRGEPIGTSSDVYSLGVVAYELLAGSRPYRLKRGRAAELEGAIAAIDAPLASATAADPAARQALKGDLDAILNKALKKHPGERYATVDAMVGDLERYLRGDRVVARPDTIGYRASRFVRRHRVPIGAVAVVAAAFALAIGIGATAVVILALLVGLGAAVWQGRAAARSRDRAYAMADRAEAVSEFLNLLLTQAARGGMALTPRQLLERSEQLVLREMRNNPEHRAAVLAMIGTSLQTLGNATDAERLLARALDAARIAGDPSFVDTIAAQHALSVGFGGRIEAAKATLEAIADRASAGPDQRAEANHYLALLAVNGGEADAALRRATEALRWLRASRRASPRFEASMLASLAGACSLNGRMVEADRHFEAALSRLAAQGQEHSPSAIAWMNNWAVVSERAGDLRAGRARSAEAVLPGAESRPDARVHGPSRRRARGLRGGAADRAGQQPRAGDLQRATRPRFGAGRARAARRRQGKAGGGRCRIAGAAPADAPERAAAHADRGPARVARRRCRRCHRNVLVSRRRTAAARDNRRRVARASGGASRRRSDRRGSCRRRRRAGARARTPGRQATLVSHRARVACKGAHCAGRGPRGRGSRGCREGARAPGGNGRRGPSGARRSTRACSAPRAGAIVGRLTRRHGRPGVVPVARVACRLRWLARARSPRAGRRCRSGRSRGWSRRVARSP